MKEVDVETTDEQSDEYSQASREYLRRVVMYWSEFESGAANVETKHRIHSNENDILQIFFTGSDYYGNIFAL